MTHIAQYILPLFKNPGAFIEIGCWDGEHISQTKELEQAGWKGVCVDPFPRNFNNRSCQVIEAAISKDGLPREFIKVYIDRRDGGDVSYFSGFKDMLKDHLFLIENYCEYEVVTVETIPYFGIHTLGYLPNHINFLSIDTEGSEQEIIKSIDFNKFTFDVIMFEHNSCPFRKELIGELLVKNGYRLKESLVIDDIYVNEKFVV